MAKLFKTSIFLLLAAFLLIAEANHHDDHKKSRKNDSDDYDDHDDSKSKELVEAKLKLKGFVPKSKSGDGGCKCNEAKFKEFLKKFIILYRAYASKELAPDLKSMLGKLVDFSLAYLAKEKPNQVNKVHTFLQNSAKITSGAVAQAGGAAFH